MFYFVISLLHSAILLIVCYVKNKIRRMRRHLIREYNIQARFVFAELNVDNWLVVCLRGYCNGIVIFEINVVPDVCLNGGYLIVVG